MPTMSELRPLPLKSILHGISQHLADRGLTEKQIMSQQTFLETLLRNSLENYLPQELLERFDISCSDSGEIIFGEKAIEALQGLSDEKDLLKKNQKGTIFLDVVNLRETRITTLKQGIIYALDATKDTD